MKNRTIATLFMLILVLLTLILYSQANGAALIKIWLPVQVSPNQVTNPYPDPYPDPLPDPNCYDANLGCDLGE